MQIKTLKKGGAKMEIMVSVRHESVKSNVKGYAENRLKSILEDKHKITSASIILDKQKKLFKAEVIVHGKHLNIEADNEAFEIHEAIDSTMEKIERQLEKFFDKKQNHHKHGGCGVNAPKGEHNEDDYNEDFID